MESFYQQSIEPELDVDMSIIRDIKAIVHNQYPGMLANTRLNFLVTPFSASMPTTIRFHYMVVLPNNPYKRSTRKIAVAGTADITIVRKHIPEYAAAICDAIDADIKECLNDLLWTE